MAPGKKRDQDIVRGGCCRRRRGWCGACRSVSDQRPYRRFAPDLLRRLQRHAFARNRARTAARPGDHPTDFQLYRRCHHRRHQPVGVRRRAVFQRCRSLQLLPDAFFRNLSWRCDRQHYRYRSRDHGGLFQSELCRNAAGFAGLQKHHFARQSDRAELFAIAQSAVLDRRRLLRQQPLWCRGDGYAAGLQHSRRCRVSVAWHWGRHQSGG